MSKKEKIISALGNLAKSLDEAILEYIVGIVDGEDFTDGESLSYQIGPLIQGSCDISDAQVLECCNKIFSSLSSKAAAPKDQMKLLNAPINISELSKDMDKLNVATLSLDKERKLPTQDAKHREAAAKQQHQRDKKSKRDGDKPLEKGANDNPTHARENFGVIRRDANSTGKGKDILLDNISLNFGATELIKDASLTLACGRRYGLVGKNGTGKSSLLRAIANRELLIPSHIQILHVEQEVYGDDTTAISSVLESDVERTMLLSAEKELLEKMSRDEPKEAAPTPTADTAQQPQNGKKNDVEAELAKIYTRLQEIDAYKAEAKASSILAGLGFTPTMQASPTKSFSGGWRMRIALARALFCEPDLLLLDEPTNMLDVRTVVWLERYLLKWKKTIFVVSHAREFLNNIATDIIHLYSKTLTHYKGDYDQFEKTRHERLSNQQKAFEAQQVERQHIQKFIDKFRYNAKRASLAQSRIKFLNKMELIPEVLEDPTFGFEFPSPEPLSPPLIDFNEVSFRYSPETRQLFSGISFGVDMDSRIAIVGINGSGKSTLLKLLVGDIPPSKGYVFRHSRLRLGRFSQHHVDQLKLDMTPVEYLSTLFPGRDSQFYRSALGKYGISGGLALQLISSLSGGQKSRVVFAQLGLQRPHVLVMDEPTNHLDIETVEVLARALVTFDGGVILVSHDERLITLVCNELWICDGSGRVTVFEGDYDAYKRSLGID